MGELVEDFGRGRFRVREFRVQGSRVQSLRVLGC